MPAVDGFKDKTTATNQLWQTDFSYLKAIGLGWFYLSALRFPMVETLLRKTMLTDQVRDTCALASCA